MAIGGILGAMDKRYRTLASTKKQSINSNMSQSSTTTP